MGGVKYKPRQIKCLKCHINFNNLSHIFLFNFAVLVHVDEGDLAVFFYLFAIAGLDFLLATLKS